MSLQFSRAEIHRAVLLKEIELRGGIGIQLVSIRRLGVVVRANEVQNLMYEAEVVVSETFVTRLCICLEMRFVEEDITITYEISAIEKRGGLAKHIGAAQEGGAAEFTARKNVDRIGKPSGCDAFSTIAQSV